MAATTRLPELLAALKEQLGSDPGSKSTLRGAYDELSRWDRRSTTGSIAMTLFSLWHEHVSRDRSSNQGATRSVSALNDVLAALERDFGTWRVTWGEIIRLQRLNESKNEKFQDEKPSLPVPGVNGNDGAVFTLYAAPERGQKRRYGVAGGSYVSVVEFAPRVRALSIHTFGASGDPQNRHFMDQARLYARGEFKPAWLRLEDIRANLEAAYHPGEEPQRPSR